MSVSIYKLKAPTLAIMRGEDGHRVPITIPANAVITVADHAAPPTAKELDDWGQLTEAHWEGKVVRMFQQDIRQRGDRLGIAASKA